MGLFGKPKSPEGVYLNPGADCGKDFTPEEIRSLLDGTLFRELKRIELSKSTMLILGQPAQPPLELLEALKRGHSAWSGYS